MLAGDAGDGIVCVLGALPHPRLVTEYAGTAERADVSICFPVRLSDFAGGMDVTVGSTC